ncbi:MULTISPECIES: sugar phosphate isomerase/epimerase family protein [Arsenicicoccus]|uniref:sugar phosphate isomerase/epimerase family protein n=1 Tax=Arsenicicoccus TaxID=267408 RepID=UPI00257A5857|nr:MULTISPECIES: sugar phosphate isomerase/epimerase [Arsenicicoccus]
MTAHQPAGPSVPSPLVALSTSSVYPERVRDAFRIASDLGYDAVEVMVYTDPVSQDAAAINDLVQQHQLPVVSIHAPTLLLTQRVMHSAPWPKIDMSLDLARAVGCDTVVVHPPFRWQRVYAREFVDGVATREHESGITIAVENMYPWRAGERLVQAYLPHWDPVEQPYDNVTLDLSHAATALEDSLEMAQALGDRLHHVHLTDGLGSALDEHLVPGRGSQPAKELLQHLASTGFAGSVVVEVSTRKVSAHQRREDLAESLAFARRHLAQPEPDGGA